MAVEVRVKAALLEHAALLAPRMRPADAAEVKAALGMGPLAALRASIEASEVCCAAFFDGEIAAIWGCSPRPSIIFGQVGDAWLLTSDVVDRHPVTFMRYCRRELRRMLRFYPVLSNAIDARHEQALRWGKRLGFRFDPPEPLGFEGRPFCRFTVSREDADHV